jgi:hypothetical protein
MGYRVYLQAINDMMHEDAIVTRNPRRIRQPWCAYSADGVGCLRSATTTVKLQALFMVNLVSIQDDLKHERWASYHSRRHSVRMK